MVFVLLGNGFHMNEGGWWVLKVYFVVLESGFPVTEEDAGLGEFFELLCDVGDLTWGEKF